MDCTGLIPCTPPPTHAPTGITGQEIATLGPMVGGAISFLIVYGLVLLTLCALGMLLFLIRD